MQNIPIEFLAVGLAIFAVLQVLSILWALKALWADPKTASKPIGGRSAATVGDNTAPDEVASPQVIPHDFKSGGHQQPESGLVAPLDTRFG